MEEHIGIVQIQSFLKSFLFSILLILSFFTCSLADNEGKEDKAFKMLKQRLIKDGFESRDIERIYAQPGVSFKLNGVLLIFHSLGIKP